MDNENKKGLSNREKKLLWFLGIFAFTAGMVMLVLMPLYNRLLDEQVVLDNLKLDKVKAEALLAEAPTIRQNNKTAIETYEEMKEIFLKEEHISEIGRMLTGLVQEHRLTPIDQKLSEPVDFEEGDAILIVAATMTVSGLYNDLTRLLNDVETIEYLRVNGVSFTVAQDQPFGTLSKISLSFEVIMIRDFV